MKLEYRNGQTVVTTDDGLTIDGIKAVNWRLLPTGESRAVLTVDDVAVDAELDEAGEWKEALLLTAEGDDALPGVPDGRRYALCPVDGFDGYLIVPAHFTGEHYVKWMRANKKAKGDPEIDGLELLLNYRVATALYEFRIEGFNARHFEQNDFHVLRWLKAVNEEYLGEVLARVF